MESGFSQIQSHLINYRIMQIVRGGKVSRLHDLLVIRGKTFAIVQQFETPCNRKAKNSLENFHDWRLNRERFASYGIVTSWLQILQKVINKITIVSF